MTSFHSSFEQSEPLLLIPHPPYMLKRHVHISGTPPPNHLRRSFIFLGSEFSPGLYALYHVPENSDPSKIPLAFQSPPLFFYVDILFCLSFNLFPIGLYPKRIINGCIKAFVLF